MRPSIIVCILIAAVAALANSVSWTSGTAYEVSPTDHSIVVTLSDTLKGLDTVAVFSGQKVSDEWETVVYTQALLAASKDTAKIELCVTRYDANGGTINTTVVDTLDVAGGFYSIPHYGERSFDLFCINRSGDSTKVRLKTAGTYNRRAVTITGK